jgi:outer membrane protein OmpA-like peptidoglycan-associated protein
MAARPDAVFRLNGYLVDSASGMPLTGIVVAIDLDENVEIEPIYINRTGFFEFRMINNRSYQLLVLGENNVRVFAEEAQNPDTVQSRIIKAIEQHKPIIFDGLQFGHNSTEVTDMLAPQLDFFIEFLKKHPYCKLIISGHTDSDGDARYNLRLSQERAQNLRNFILSSSDLDSAVVIAEGYGETRPIYPNDFPENKAKNRRVEFEIIVPQQYQREFMAELERERPQLLTSANTPDPVALLTGDELMEFDNEADLMDFALAEQGDDALTDVNEDLEDDAFDRMQEERDEFYELYAEEFVDEYGEGGARLAAWLDDTDNRTLTVASNAQTEEAGLVRLDEAGNPITDDEDYTDAPDFASSNDPEQEPRHLQENPTEDTPDEGDDADLLADGDPTEDDPNNPDPTENYPTENPNPAATNRTDEELLADFESDFNPARLLTTAELDENIVLEDEWEMINFTFRINEDINDAMSMPEFGSYVDNEPMLDTEVTARESSEDILQRSGRDGFDFSAPTEDEEAPTEDEDTADPSTDDAN